MRSTCFRPQGRDAIEQGQQRIAILARQRIDLQRENLAELEEAAAQPLEQAAQQLGTMMRTAAQAAVKEGCSHADEFAHDFEHAGEMSETGQVARGHLGRNSGTAGAAPFNTLPQKMLLRLGSMSSMLRCTMS